MPPIPGGFNISTSFSCSPQLSLKGSSVTRSYLNYQSIKCCSLKARELCNTVNNTINAAHVVFLSESLYLLTHFNAPRFPVFLVKELISNKMKFLDEI